MEILKVYTNEQLSQLTRLRKGEAKLGECMPVITGDWKTFLRNSAVKFVIVGIAEDLGVRANQGRPGAATAFKPALESFLNQQDNQFMNGSDICVLGEIYTEDLLLEADTLDHKNNQQLAKLRELVAVLDGRVTEVIANLVGLQKIPIIIGGGHNNSYGNIKGAYKALGKKINAVNCDPHLDFRELEGRHSGNGFSYAFEEGYLDKYAVFGLHEQYNNRLALQQFNGHRDRLFYNSYESVFVREEFSLNTAISQCIGFVKGNDCGLEIDLDAIINVPSSAKTSSGISPIEARQFIHRCAVELKPVYLHIAEGAPVLSHIKADNKTGKLIAYLISDFIKAFYRD